MDTLREYHMDPFRGYHIVNLQNKNACLGARIRVFVTGQSLITMKVSRELHG